MPEMFASLPVLFSLTLFISAALLFTVELMIAKMILPLLGGTPAVWNTCMMFFQAVLLAGYGYAHVASVKTGIIRQILIHSAILVVGCLVLPIAVPQQWVPAAEGNPIGPVLLVLLISVGLPFFVLSATAPLLQRWFARTGHPSAGDPYFLYSASNLGSMVALIGYPIAIEPYFRLVQQSRAWSVAYGAVLILTLLCAVATWRYRSVCPPAGGGSGQSAACDAAAAPLTYRERGSWLLLAFVPSSLMLGVTSFLSTDVAAVPLFWIIPLALYLLSFIIVFARFPAAVHRVMVTLLPVAIAVTGFVNFANVGIPKEIVFVVHLANFFVISMVCHGEIARTRPAADHLTEFYLWMSLGGVLGGIFNSLIAPLVFTAVLEYPLVLVLAALLLPARHRLSMGDRLSAKEIALYLGVTVAMIALAYYSTVHWPVRRIDLYWLSGLLDMRSSTLDTIVTYGLLFLLGYGLVFLRRRFLFGIGMAALFFTLFGLEEFTHDIVYRHRSFFGVLKVTESLDGTFMKLTHGTTLHGKQWLNPVTRLEPVSYYHREGPAGKVFAEFSGEKRKDRIAVAGLGTGSIAAYAGPGQQIDFYEIDPAVKTIATNPAYFSFLSECRANWKVILGDARLTMGKAPPHSYDIIILDAFSSDAIPVHLLTKEAVALYLSRLVENGVLLLHITNRYLNLAPVLARLAEEHGLAARIRDDYGDPETGKDGSTWVLLARKETSFGTLAFNGDWERIEPRAKLAAWTDDFSNIFAVFKW